MSKIIYLKIAKDNSCGFCNQIYALVGCIDYSIRNKINIIIVDNFLKEINKNQYCPLSEIIDINKYNEYLKKYNLSIIDSNFVNFKILSVKYGTNTNMIDITKKSIDSFLFNNIFDMIIIYIILK